MHFVLPRDARLLPGLKLILPIDLPGPWAEAVKSVFQLRNVRYSAVAQIPMAENAELLEWIGCRNAPAAVYEDEAPRTSWLDLLYLAERLGSGASLLPDDESLRAECIGVTHAIAGEDGLGWNRRLAITGDYIAALGGDFSLAPLPAALNRAYGIEPKSVAAAPGRIVSILRMLDDRLGRQRAAGSSYLMGGQLTACDIYWAQFSNMLAPLPADVCPMPDYQRTMYSINAPAVATALSDGLIAHREFIFQTYLSLPMDFMADPAP